MFGIIILSFSFFYRTSVSVGFSSASHFLFRPFLVFGNTISRSFSNTSYFFNSKKALYRENENLKLEILQSEADRANYLSVLDENIKLKEILGRKKEGHNMVVASILSKPNRSIYDTIIVDVGTKQGVDINQRVFALGNIPIGKISEVYLNSSKVVLFSNREEKTEVLINGKDTYMQVVGRGGGNFEIILPKDFNLENGTEIILPGITPYVLGIVAKTISDPRDAFGKALVVSPVNIQSLKFVGIEQ